MKKLQAEMRTMRTKKKEKNGWKKETKSFQTKERFIKEWIFETKIEKLSLRAARVGSTHPSYLLPSHLSNSFCVS